VAVILKLLSWEIIEHTIFKVSHNLFYMFRLPEKSKIYTNFFLKYPDSCQEPILHSQFLFLILLDPLHVQILQGDIDQCSPATMKLSTLTSQCLKLFIITSKKALSKFVSVVDIDSALKYVLWVKFSVFN
jgi:hypothetical protein